MPSILTHLTNLKNESGNKKLALFEELLKTDDGPLLEEVFHSALGSEHNFHVKKVDIGFSDTPLSDLRTAIKSLHENLATRKLTGNAAKAFIWSMTNTLSKDDAEVVRMILDRKLDCGISVTNANKYMSKKIPTFSVMLCEDNDPKFIKKIPFKTGSIVQTKSDGLRIIISVSPDGEVKYRSRSGKEYNFPFLDSKLQDYKGQVFDGEALVYQNGVAMPRKSGNGILNSIQQGDFTEAPNVRFVIWDSIPYADFFNGHCSTPYSERLEKVKEVCDKVEEFLLQETWVVHSLEEVEEIYNDHLSKEQEGVILKDPNAPYETKRVQHQLKFKAVLECDLRILDMESGTGKNKNKLGAIIVGTDCGQLRVDVGIGFDDKDREKLWKNKEFYIRKIASINYNEVISSKGKKEYSLFLPVFVEVREDKTEPDSLDTFKLPKK